MPGMTLRQMLADEEETFPSTIKVGRGEINLRTINPQMVSTQTIENLDWLDRTDAKKPSLHLAAELLTRRAMVVTDIVSWWDVIGEDGQPVPLVLEEVKKVPNSFLLMVINHFIGGGPQQVAQAGESQPGEQTKTASGNSSLRQAKSGTSRNGITTLRPVTASTRRPGRSSATRPAQRRDNAGPAPRSSRSAPKSPPKRARNSRSSD